MITKKSKDSQEKNKKIYVLDTNVLVYDPQVIFNFDGVHIGILAVVREELE